MTPSQASMHRAQVMQANCWPSRMSMPIGQTATQALQSTQSPAGTPAAAAANYGNPSLAHFPRGPSYSPASEYARIFCLSTGAPAVGDGDGESEGGGGGGGAAVATPHNCAEYFSAKAQFYVAGLETCPPARSACAAQGKSAGFHCTRQLFSGFAKPDSGFYACPGGYQQLQQCPATTECRETAPGSVSCVRGG